MVLSKNAAMKTMVLTLLLIIGITPALRAQSPSSEDQMAEHQVQLLDAYKSTHTYMANIHYEFRETSGRWQFLRRSTFRIAFDRPQRRLMLDLPDLFLLVDGSELRLHMTRFKERHLVIDTPQPFSHAALIKLLPPDLLPELPSLKLLLGQDISTTEPEKQVFTYHANPNDSQRRHHLEFCGPRYKALLGLDPTTSLVSTVELRWKPETKQQPPETFVQSIHQIDIVHHNTELPEGLFVFDITGSKPVTTLTELAGHHRLEGKPAPRFELRGLDGQSFKLGNAKSRIVLLSFWATWYPGRHQELRSLQRLQAWANRNSLSMKIITINIKDPIEKIRTEVKRQGINLPVLLATDDTVVNAYDANELPHTVLIVDGRVARILDTVETKETALQNGINRLLSQAPATQPTNGRPPTP